MNTMAFTQKYGIVKLFEKMPEGTEFSSDKWPLHSTVADVFAVNWDTPTLTEKLARGIGNCVIATSIAENDRYFGDNGEIQVTLLQKTDSLVKLHHDVVGLLEEGGWTPNDPQFAKESFLPHATVQPHARLNEGDEVTFDTLSIVDFYPNEDPYMRRIIKTIPIGQ